MASYSSLPSSSNRDDDYEYKPSELGVPGDEDYHGRYRANEALLFLAYGITDAVAVEFEMAGINASRDKSTSDPSGVPARIGESGLGDVERQVRWRWGRETDRRPEVFSYAEVVVPHHDDKPLIGTAGWQFKVGTGVVRGSCWGTLTARAAVEYDAASSSKFDLLGFGLTSKATDWAPDAGIAFSFGRR